MKKYIKRFLLLTLLSITICYGEEPNQKNSKKETTFSASIEYYSIGSSYNLSYQSTRVPYISIKDSFQKYALENSLEYKKLLELNDTEKRAILYRVSKLERNDMDEKTRATLIENALDIFSLSKVKSIKEMNNFLSNTMSFKSFGEKISFLTNLLSHASDNYEYQMLEDDNIVRKISHLEMLQAINHSIQTGEVAPSGVCRHIHQLAIQVANGMGLKNVFGVGFRTQGSGHRTIIIGVPGDPTQVVQLNYGEETIVRSTVGISALSQNHSIPDTGIKFRIYNGNDEAVILIPSEQGAILNRVSGGKDSDLGAQFKSHSQINQVGIKTPYGLFRLFKARSIKNFGSTNVSGVVYEKNFNFFDFFNTSFGFTGFETQRDLTEDNTLTMRGLYFRNDTGFNWKFYSSQFVDLATFNELHLRGTFYCSYLNNSKCSKNTDEYISINSGFSVNLKFKKGNNKTSVMFQSQMAPNHATYKNRQTLIVPSVTFSNKFSFALTDDYIFNNYINLTHYNLGTHTFNVLNTENTINSKKLKLNLFYSYNKPLNNNIPTWLPGGQEVNVYGLSKSFLNEKINLSTRYEAYDDSLYNNVGLQLKLDL